MAYGLEVFDANGARRLYLGTWQLVFYAAYNFGLNEGASRTIYIPGFDPAHSVVQVRYVEGGYLNSADVKIEEHPGYVYCKASDQWSNTWFVFDVYL